MSENKKDEETDNPNLQWTKEIDILLALNK